MKFNLNTEIVDLDGEKLAGSNLGKTIAQSLAYSQAGDPLKFMTWATKMFNGEELDLDPSDLNTFKDFIKNSQLSVLLKARVLEVFLKTE